MVVVLKRHLPWHFTLIPCSPLTDGNEVHSGRNEDESVLTGARTLQFSSADNRNDITSPQTDILINLVSPELFWKREPFTPASYLVSAIIGFCILPCSIYDGRITFWALTSWQGFILLPLLMTSSLQVNCRCNDFLFCFWILLKCHHDPRHLNLA